MCSVPPRNALLLMRSRSKPGRRSTLATRFLDDDILMNSKLVIEGKSEELVVKSEAILVKENKGKVEIEQLDGEEVEINVNGSSPEPVLDRSKKIPTTEMHTIAHQ
ncbi:hypothetical protein Syun_021141 [Stephania yunnanensis]|uniref:Uncharacterized protein n=1 Tax=Stephania yunnanensis TaxID=152371 RepID=A0AAP0IF38_9MAGN